MELNSFQSSSVSNVLHNVVSLDRLKYPSMTKGHDAKELIIGLHGWLIWKIPVSTLILLKVRVIRFE
jgi:hypothetical protein